MNIIGIDASADRLAYAHIAGGHLTAGGEWDCKGAFPDKEIRKALGPWLIDYPPESVIFCLEINLRPFVVNKGALSPRLIKNYMRSRWVEGRFMESLGFPEPVMIERKRGGYFIPHRSKFHCLQAKSEGNRKGADAKKARRARMEAIYGLKHKFSQDLIDALAIAHECEVALKTGFIEKGAEQ